MFKYEIYMLGKKTKNLVIFLHGYNGNIEDHQYAIDWLKNKLKSAHLVIPEAPEICDKNPTKKQWFGMIKYDPDKKRLQPQTTATKIFSIYNKAKDEIDEKSIQINDFITELQKKYKITDSQTYVIGFSQGAMLTIYTTLSRTQKIASGFALSGLIAGSNLLAKKIKSYPKIYLFHGEDDNKVQFKTLHLSTKWLERHHIPHNSLSYKNLAHKITEEEIDYICDIINNNSKKEE